MKGKFTKDTTFTLMARFLQLLLSLATTAVIGRTLGPQGKGIYAIAVLLPSLIIAFTNIGTGTASVYYIGQRKYSLKKIFGFNILVTILVSILAVSAGLIAINFFGDRLFPNIEKSYLFISLILVPLNIFLNFTLNILLGLQKIGKYNFAHTVQSIVLLLLNIIFLLGFHWGVTAAISADILAILAACIILFFFVLRESKGFSFNFDKVFLKDFISYGSKIYLANIVNLLHYRVDAFILNIMSNPAAVGLYSVAVGISEKIWLISQSAGIVIFPKISSETDKKRLKEFTPLVCRNVLFVTFLISIILFFLSRWVIVLLYSEQFLKSVAPFQILLIGSIALSGGRIISNDLAGRGRPFITAIADIFSVVLNVILNIVLIPKIGIIGAAWSSAISYTLISIFVIIIYSRISGNKIRDIVLIKKEDFKFYKGFALLLKNKYFNF